MEFGFTTKEKGNTLVISLSGGLIDKLQAQDLSEAIEEFIVEDKNRFILDLSDLKYINSTGLNLLITLLTKARKSGGELVITNVSKKISELFLITKLNTVFTVAPNMDEAMEKLK